MKKSALALTTVAWCVAVAGTSLTPAHAAPTDFVLSRGHIDLFEVTFDPVTQLPRLMVKDDTALYGEGTVFRDPATVTIDADHLQAAFDVPDDLPESYDFFGDAGDRVYMLPETMDEDLPWPGWSTERLLGSLPQGVTVSSADDAVKISLDIVGPGHVHSFMSSPFGEPINHYVDTTTEAPDVLPAGAHSHVHTTWLFSEPGSYTFSATPSVTTSMGAVLTGPEVDYHLHIGDPIAPIAPVSQDPGPTILGTPAVGEQLLGLDGDWQPAPTEYVARQWLRDGIEIQGADQHDYVVQEADLGHALTFRSTTRIGRETRSATSAPLPVPVAVSNVAAPTITKIPQVGALSTTTPGAWSTDGLTYSYQWLRNGLSIPGASGASYRPVAADHGRPLSVRVRANKAGFAQGEATSAARVVRLGAQPRATSRPRLTGTAKVGRRLTVTRGVWSPGGVTLSYQWRVGGKIVPGRTASFAVTRAHQGKKVSVTVTARRAGYAAGSVVVTSARVSR